MIITIENYRISRVDEIRIQIKIFMLAISIFLSFET